MKNRFAWILGFLSFTACGNDGSTPNPGSSSSTTAGGNTTGTTQSGPASGSAGATSSSSSPATSGSAGSPTTSTTASGAGGDPVATGAGGGSTGGTTTGTGGGGGSGPGGGGTSTGTGGKTDAGSTGGAGPTDASTGGDGVSPGGCSDPGPNPTPKSPFVKANPLDMKFPFSSHWMGMFADNTANAHCISMTSLTDLDKDGDLDFADGQRDVSCSGQSNANAPMIWWEYCNPDHWVRHVAGTGFSSAASGGAGDFDGDGWIDLVAGNSWFKNPGANVRTAASWMRYPTGAPGLTEEIAMGDLTGDGRLDALYVVNTIDPQWWTGGQTPTSMWTKTTLSTYRQQQGAAIGDIDGDGKNDAIVGDHWWYQSPTWKPIPIATDSNAATPAFASNMGFATNAPQEGSAPLTMIGDINGDGHNDIAMSSHWGYNVAWMENKGGTGMAWVLHMIPATARPMGAINVLHAVVADDFDNDGDLDILVAENQGSLWIYENADPANGAAVGNGTKWVEHKIGTGPGHEARAADVDCDGDLDIVGKSWSDPNDGKAGASEIAALLGHHVYYKNELVERGGTPVFVRPKGEVWNTPDKGRCKP